MREHGAPKRRSMPGASRRECASHKCVIRWRWVFKPTAVSVLKNFTGLWVYAKRWTGGPGLAAMEQTNDRNSIYAVRSASGGARLCSLSTRRQEKHMPSEGRHLKLQPPLQQQSITPRRAAGQTAASAPLALADRLAARHLALAAAARVGGGGGARRALGEADREAAGGVKLAVGGACQVTGPVR